MHLPSDTRGRGLAVERLIALLLLAVLPGVALIPGCRKPVTVPPITTHPTGQYHAGKFVWADLITSDVESAKEFYGKLFGWQFEGEQGKTTPFTLITQGGVPIGGIVYREELDPAQREARWLSYISVPDVDSAAAAAQQLGGRVYVAPFDLPQRGRVAVILDPQKVPVGLLKASGGDPPDEKVIPYRWMWRELWTTDTASALVFYRDLALYTKESVKLSLRSEQYTVLMSHGKARAGVGQLPRQGMEPLWLPYVNVDEPRSIAERTVTLGGTVLLAPDSAISRGSVGLIADPTGGILAIQRWTAEDTMSK